MQILTPPHTREGEQSKHQTVILVLWGEMLQELE